MTLQVLFERDTRKEESSFPSGSRAFKKWPDTAKFGESGRNPGAYQLYSFSRKVGFPRQMHKEIPSIGSLKETSIPFQGYNFLLAFRNFLKIRNRDFWRDSWTTSGSKIGKK